MHFGMSTHRNLLLVILLLLPGIAFGQGRPAMKYELIATDTVSEGITVLYRVRRLSDGLLGDISNRRPISTRTDRVFFLTIREFMATRKLQAMPKSTVL
jgi:hypothetical protein